MAHDLMRDVRVAPSILAADFAHQASDLPADPAIHWGRLDNGLRYALSEVSVLASEEDGVSAGVAEVDKEGVRLSATTWASAAGERGRTP